MYEIDNENNIKLTRGDTLKQSLTIQSADGSVYHLTDGDRVDLSVKENGYSDEYIIQKTYTAADQQTDGTIPILISPEDTSNLKYGKYRFDVQITLADGTVDTIITPRNFELTEEITWEI